MLCYGILQLPPSPRPFMDIIAEQLPTIRERYAARFSDPAFVRSFIWGFVFLLVSLVINWFASFYAAERASSSVTDIILSNIPVFDVDGFFVWGPVVFWAFMAVIAFRDPKNIPFCAKTIAVFIIIRSVFITLTHIGPYPTQAPMDVFGANWLQHLTDNANFFIFSSGSDLFFSAHTGLPFLMGLIFWKDKPIRTFCIIAAAFFGVIVLLGHLHYSIDVASAFFITYTIYHIAEWAFKADRRRFYA